MVWFGLACMLLNWVGDCICRGLVLICADRVSVVWVGLDNIEMYGFVLDRRDTFWFR